MFSGKFKHFTKMWKIILTVFLKNVPGIPLLNQIREEKTKQQNPEVTQINHWSVFSLV